MKTHRFWIEIVILGSMAALALALILATLGAAAATASGDQETGKLESPSPADAPRVFEGVITCSRCGARHPAALDRPASRCVRECVHAGASFALVNADVTYLLEGDLYAFKKLAGERVRISGVLEGNTIRVNAAVAAT